MSKVRREELGTPHPILLKPSATLLHFSSEKKQVLVTGVQI